MIWIILLIILLYVCYSKYIRKDSVVKVGGYGILIVMTGSMEPTIEQNELIVIKECEKYNINDITTYVDVYGNLITHRIWQIEEGKFRTKGDSNEIFDEITDMRNIQGKVIYHSKIFGIFVLYYLRFVVLIYVIFLGILYGKEKLVKGRKYEEKEE